MYKDRTELNNIHLCIDGQVVTRVESFTAQPYTVHTQSTPLGFMSHIVGSLSLQGAVINAGYLGGLTDTIRADLTVTRAIKPIPRKPRSKKTRIQAKWQKRYEASVVHQVYKNVEMMSAHE